MVLNMEGLSVKRLRHLNIKYFPKKLIFGPEWIVLGVNNICNLHCKMCDVGTGFQGSNFYHHLMGAKPLNMPLELIFRIIEQTAQYYPKAKLGYGFTEPSIYPHLVESLRLADEKGLYTSITTNALLLGRQAKELTDAGLDALCVSLDGPPEIHNSIRGKRDSFEKAFQGMEKIVSYGNGKPAISVYCTITEWNIGHLREFADLFRDLPLNQMGFMHTNFVTEKMAQTHNGEYSNDYPATVSCLDQVTLEKMDLKTLWEEIREIKETEYPFQVIFSPEIDTKSGLDRFYFHPHEFIGTFCFDSFRNLMIKSDGSVIPSHGRCYKVNVGNIYQNTLKEIWHSIALQRFRKALLEAGGLLPACSRCCSAFE